MGNKCQTCVDRHKTDKEEPCSTCCRNYLDKHTVPAVYNKIDCVPGCKETPSIERRLAILENTVYQFFKKKL